MDMRLSLQSNPTASLTTALQRLESTFNDDEKRQYRANCSNLDPSSIIAFTAKVDSASRSRASRCVAPRICTFLEKTLEFVGVIDTFVSSKPQVAALVWGSVKMTILIASRVASYFEKITSLLMDVGKICPILKEFGHLYPGCPGLQESLCDFYASVLQMCAKIIEVSHRTTATQAIHSIFNPFETELKPFQQDLQKLNDIIQLQISFASKYVARQEAKLAELERDENARHRRRVLTFHAHSIDEQNNAQEWRLQKARREMAKMRSKIKSNLCKTSTVKAWKQAMKFRAPNTADWYQQDAEFDKWLSQEETSVLWVSGIMGTGKTVLVSNMIAFLSNRDPSNAVSYHFCCSDLEETLQAKNVLGSLACQAMEPVIAQASEAELEDLVAKTQDLDVEEMVEFLTPHLQSGKRYYFIIDGLDECNLSETRILAQEICKLRQKSTRSVKIVCSSRPELEAEIFHDHSPSFKVSSMGARTQSDINNYIVHALGCCLERGQLKLRDENILLKVVEELQRQSCGMFLWARLVIENICTQLSDDDILDALNYLPSSLSELFTFNFTRVQRKARSRAAIKILQFCGVSRRPLTLDEFQELLSVQPGQVCLNHRRKPNNMTAIISDCCGLAFVDEEDRTVHYVHHSLRDHFFADKAPRQDRFSQINLDTELGDLCLTYLNFNDFNRDLAKIPYRPGMKIDPLSIGTVSLDWSKSKAALLARGLIRHRKQEQERSTVDLERISELVSHSSSSKSARAQEEFAFLKYAQIHWVYHLTHLDKTAQPVTWDLFCSFAHGTVETLAERPWHRIRTPNGSASLRAQAVKGIEWAYERKHLPLFLSLIESDRWTQDASEPIFVDFAKKNKPNIVEFMLKYSCQSLQTLTDLLVITSGLGHLATLMTLLSVGANVNSGFQGFQCKSVEKKGLMKIHGDFIVRLGSTALHAASECGNLEVSKQLLRAGARIDEMMPLSTDELPCEPIDFRRQTKLQCESRAWTFEHGVMRHSTLLGEIYQTYDNACLKKYGWTALCFAAANGHIEVLEALLDKGANAEYATNRQVFHKNALEIAERKRYSEVVERLRKARSQTSPAYVNERRELIIERGLDNFIL